MEGEGKITNFCTSGVKCVKLGLFCNKNSVHSLGIRRPNRLLALKTMLLYMFLSLVFLSVKWGEMNWL